MDSNYQAAKSARINLEVNADSTSIKNLSKDYGTLVKGLENRSAFEALSTSVESANNAVIGLGYSFTNTATTIGNTPFNVEDKLDSLATGFEKVEDVAGNRIAKIVFPQLTKQLDSFADKGTPVFKLLNDLTEETTAFDKSLVLVSKASKPLIKAIDTLETVLEKLEAGLKAVGIQSKFLETSFDKLQNVLGTGETLVKLADLSYKARESLEDLKTTLGDVSSNVLSTGQALAPMVLNFENLDTTISSVGGIMQMFGKGAVKTLGGIASQSVGITTLATGINKLGQSVGDLYVKWTELSKGFEALQTLGIDTSLASITSNLGLMGENILFNINATKELIATATQAYSKLRSATDYIQTLSAGAAYEVEDLNSSLQGLANKGLKNAISSAELGSSVYNNLSAGIGAAAGQIQDALEVTQATAKYSSATGSNLEQTQQALIFTSKAFGFSAKESSSALVKMDQIVQQGITNSSELAANIGSLASVASSTGTSFDAMGTALAIATKSLGGDAYISIQRLYSSLSSLAPQSKKALDQLGVSINAEVLRTKDLTTIMQDLYKKAGGNLEILQQVIPESVAFRGALSLMKASTQETQATMQAFANTTPKALDEMFDRSQQSIQKRGEALANGFEELFASAGEKIVNSGIYEAGIGALEGLLNYFKNMPEPLQNVLGAVIGLNLGLEKLVTVGGSLIGVFTALVSVVGSFLLYFRGGAFVSGLTKGFKAAGDNAGLFSKALSAVKGGLQESIGLSVKLTENGLKPMLDANNEFVKSTEGIRGKLQGAFNSIKTGVDKVTTSFSKSFAGIKDGTKAVGEGVLSVGEKLVFFGKNVGSTYEGLNFKTVSNFANLSAESIVGSSKNINSALIETKGIFGKAAEEARYYAVSGTKYYSELNPELSKYIGLNLTQLPIVQKVTGAFSKFKDALINTISTTKEMIGSISKFNSLDMIKDSILDTTENITKGIKNVANNIKNVLTTDLRKVNFKELLSNIDFNPKTLITKFKQIPEQLNYNLKYAQSYIKYNTALWKKDLANFAKEFNLPNLNINEFKNNALEGISNVLTNIQNKFKNLKIDKFDGLLNSLQQGLGKLYDIDFNPKKLVDNVSKNFNTIKETASKILNSIKLDPNTLIDSFKQLPTLLGSSLGKLKNTVSNFSKNIKLPAIDLNEFKNNTLTEISNVLTGIQNKFKSFKISNLDGVFSSLQGSISKALDFDLKPLQDKFVNAFKGISSNLGDQLTNIKSSVNKFSNEVGNNLSNITKKFKLDVLGDNVKRNLKVLSNNFDQFKDKVINSLSGVGKQFGVLKDNILKLKIFDGLSKQVDTFKTNTTDTISSIGKGNKFEGISNIGKILSANFNIATESVKGFTNSLVQSFAQTKVGATVMPILSGSFTALGGVMTGVGTLAKAMWTSVLAPALPLVAIVGVLGVIRDFIPAFGSATDTAQKFAKGTDGIGQAAKRADKDLTDLMKKTDKNFKASNMQLDSFSAKVINFGSELIRAFSGFLNFITGGLAKTLGLTKALDVLVNMVKGFAGDIEATFDTAAIEQMNKELETTDNYILKIKKSTKDLSNGEILPTTQLKEEVKNYGEYVTAFQAKTQVYIDSLGNSEKDKELKKVAEEKLKEKKDEYQKLIALTSSSEQMLANVQKEKRTLTAEELNKLDEAQNKGVELRKQSIQDEITVAQQRYEEMKKVDAAQAEQYQTRINALNQELGEIDKVNEATKKRRQVMNDFTNDINNKTLEVNENVKNINKAIQDNDEKLDKSLKDATGNRKQAIQDAKANSNAFIGLADTISNKSKEIEKTQGELTVQQKASFNSLLNNVKEVGLAIDDTLDNSFDPASFRSKVDYLLEETQNFSEEVSDPKIIQDVVDKLEKTQMSYVDGTGQLVKTTLDKTLSDDQLRKLAELKISVIDKVLDKEMKDLEDKKNELQDSLDLGTGNNQQVTEQLAKLNADSRKLQEDSAKQKLALLEKSFGKESNEYKDQYDKLIELQRQFKKDSLQEQKDLIDSRFDAQSKALDKERALLEKGLNDGVNEKEFEQQQSLAKRELELKVSNIQEQIKLYKEGSSKRLDLEKDLIEATNALDKLGDDQKKEQRERRLNELDVANQLEATKQQEALEKGNKSRFEVEQAGIDNTIKTSKVRIQLMQEELETLDKNSIEYKQLYAKIAAEQLNLAKTVKDKSKAIREQQLKETVADNELEKVQTEKAIYAGNKTREQAARESIVIDQENSLARQKILQAELKELKVGSLEYKEKLAELGKEQLNFQKSQIEGVVLELNQALEQQSLGISKNIAELNKVTNSYDSLIKNLELENQIRQNNANFVKEQTSIEMDGLKLKDRTTTDIVKKAENNLELVEKQNELNEQQYELDKANLDNQLKVNKANQERELIQIRINKLELDRNILQAKNKLEIAKLNKETAANIGTLELELASLEEQGKVISTNEELLKRKGAVEEQSLQQQQELLDKRNELTKANGLLDKEIAKEQIIIAGYEKQLQQLNVRNKQLELSATEQLSTQDDLNKAYERRSKLLEAQKSLLEGMKSSTEQSLQMALQGATSDKQKNKLQEQYNKVRVSIIQKQQEVELNLFNLQQKQNSLALERQKIENNIAKTKQEAALLEAQIEQKKVLARKDATDEEKELAALQVKSAEQSLDGVVKQSAYIEQQIKDQKVIDKISKDNFTRQQELALLQEQQTVASSTKSTKDDKLVQKQIENTFSKNLNELSTSLNKLDFNELNKLPEQIGIELKDNIKDIKLDVKQDALVNKENTSNKNSNNKEIKIEVTYANQITVKGDIRDPKVKEFTEKEFNSMFNKQNNALLTEVERRLK